MNPYRAPTLLQPQERCQPLGLEVHRDYEL